MYRQEILSSTFMWSKTNINDKLERSKITGKENNLEVTAIIFKLGGRK